MPTNIDSVIARLTAFDSLAHLKAHVARGGKAPSFRLGSEGATLADALLLHGIQCTVYE